MSLLPYLHVQEIKPPRTENYDILDRGIFCKILNFLQSGKNYVNINEHLHPFHFTFRMLQASKYTHNLVAKLVALTSLQTTA
jgi:hypothetical protein